MLKTKPVVTGGGGQGQPAAPGQTTSTSGALQTTQPDTGGGAGEMVNVYNTSGMVERDAGDDPSSGQTTEDAG